MVRQRRGKFIDLPQIVVDRTRVQGQHLRVLSRRRELCGDSVALPAQFRDLLLSLGLRDEPFDIGVHHPVELALPLGKPRFEAGAVSHGGGGKTLPLAVVAPDVDLDIARIPQLLPHAIDHGPLDGR
ncbi:hypothetical protein [Microvirga arsenatis]|uniref:hypothetical protein n=1 Tax=Microvirga arsenatis TaxID=2692265 RepID=UPI001FEDDF8C|nr:hypothetical protein [Microvirga arsenatis]